MAAFFWGGKSLNKNIFGRLLARSYNKRNTC